MNRSRKSVRALLLGGAAAASIAAHGMAAMAQDIEHPTASAGAVEERQDYVLRLMMQIYDGRKDFSHSQIMSVARVRQDGQSYNSFDFGDGAVVITGDGGQLSASRFMNVSPAENALIYDYGSKTLQGSTEAADFHNTVIRPLLGRAPDLGQDAKWSSQVPLAELFQGLGAGGVAQIELSREYFVHDGKAMVLIHYAIPAFTYSGEDRRPVVHWGRGMALTDPGFGMIYLNTAVHRAVASAEDGASVPYRYARTMVAASPDGSAMIDYREVPQLMRHYDEFFSEEAMEVVPSQKKSLDDTPVQMARKLDVIALSLGEDGANEVPIAAILQSGTSRGVEVSNAADAALAGAETHASIQALMGSAMGNLQGFLGKLRQATEPGKSGTQNGADPMRDLMDAQSSAQALLGKLAEAANVAASDPAVSPDIVSQIQALQNSVSQANSTLQQAVSAAATGDASSPQVQSSINSLLSGAQQFTSGVQSIVQTSQTQTRSFMEAARQAGVNSAPVGGQGASSGAGLESEVTQGTIEALNASRSSGGGIRGTLNTPNSNTLFGNQGAGGTTTTDLPAKSIVERGGVQIGNLFGGDDGRQIGQEIGAFVDLMVEQYGPYDKFVAAGGGIADLQKDMDKLNSGLAALQGAVGRLGNLQGKAASVANSLVSTNNEIKRLQQLVNTEFPNMTTAQTERILTNIERLQETSRNLIAEARALDRQISYLAQIKQQLPALERKIANFARMVPDSRLAGYFAQASNRLDALKVSPALTILGGMGNIAAVYSAGTSLRDFDPSNPDLKLSSDYSSAGAVISSLALDVLGVAGNVATGNLLAASADVLTFASTRATDLFKAYSAANQTKLDMQTAEMQAELTRKRLVANLEEKLAAAYLSGDQQEIARLSAQLAKEATPQEVRDIYGRLPIPGGLYAPGGARRTDYNTDDPRWDPETGLPKTAEFWAWLKKNNPGSLIAAGIDPEAPVGGWPGGVGPEHRPTSSAQAPSTPGKPRVAETSIGEGPDYPTAPKSEAKPSSQARTEFPRSPVISAEEQAQIERDARQAEAQRNLDAYQEQKLAERKAEEEARAQTRGSYEYRTSALEVSELKTSSFGITKVTFSGVTFTPVTSDPVVSTIKDIVASKLTTSRINVSSFPPTDPDDTDGYPGTGQYPAFGYASMSGTVETDLSRWAEWLETQDVAYLTKLARDAGYPNLASALNKAEEIMQLSQDEGYRRWAMSAPSCGGYVGCGPSYLERWTQKRSIVVLGDILALSRGIFSTGGFSDIGISGFNLMYILRDFGIQDGDLIDLEITQFGRTIFTLKSHFLLNGGSPFNVNLRPGVAQMVITALNEGSSPPNTAEVFIENVVRGDARQTYSLNTGQTAVLRIEANATPEPSAHSPSPTPATVVPQPPIVTIPGKRSGIVHPNQSPIAQGPSRHLSASRGEIR